MIVPLVVPSRPSRVRLHVTREHAQRDERRDEHRACRMAQPGQHRNRGKCGHHGETRGRKQRRGTVIPHSPEWAEERLRSHPGTAP